MPTNFCITVLFLQPYNHGRGNDGEPQWPPSPLRLFQALVAAAAARWNDRIRLEYAIPALRWLERQPVPTIVAAPGVRSEAKYRLYVPDNVADKVARSWSAGREASIADFRTEKDVCPTRLLGEVVHYLIPVAKPDPEFETHRNVLIDAARSITHLGWGVDMVACNAAVLSEEEAANLTGERWQPGDGTSANGLRVPIKGTLDDLANKHTAFLNRLSDEGFKPVPPLSEYRVVGYRRATDPARRDCAAFAILKPDASGFRAFDTPRRAITVAGMVRNAVDRAAIDAGRSQEWRNTFIHGHTPDGSDCMRGEGADRRLAYLPLPTINPLKVEMIRRVLVVGPSGARQDIDWVRRSLAGHELFAEGSDRPQAILSIIPADDRAVRPYTASSAVWSTVTPVVMPGHDDGDAAKAERLLRRAFVQAGLAPGLVQAAELEWRHVGFRAGVDLSTRYERPHSVRLPRFHVRVRFPVAIPGPLAVGAMRYRGLGTFAGE